MRMALGNFMLIICGKITFPFALMLLTYPKKKLSAKHLHLLLILLCVWVLFRWNLRRKF